MWVFILLLMSPVFAAQHVLAVTYFDAHSIQPELEPLGRGVADMLMTDLAQAEGLRVVERARLNEVLGELELQRSQYIDPETAQKLGEGLGANTVVVGSITVATGGMRLDARVVDVASGEVTAAVQAVGPAESFFELEQTLASRLLGKLGVESVELDTLPLSLEAVVESARRIDEADAAAIDRLSAARQYKKDRLHLTDKTITSGSADGGISTSLITVVADGHGTVYTAIEFAEKVGDQEIAEQLRRRRTVTHVAGGTVVAVGAGLLVAGMAADPDGGGRDPAAERREMVGIVAGSSLFVLGAWGWKFAVVRQNYPQRAYEDLDGRIVQYNAQLARDLGLRQSDALMMDLQAD